MDNPTEILQSVFGYDCFRGFQQQVIEQVTEGGDALVLMPTGGGKSLCFQIPALLRPGVAIVVSPLIALMQDQVDALQQLGIRAAYLNSTLDYQTAQQIENQLLSNDLDLIYVAPERLLSERNLLLFQRAEIALFAIDEAHCVSQWGHDFRPEYQKLSMLHERFPAVPRIALTATADQRTRDEIIAQLRLQDAAVFISSFDRPNIRYTIAEGLNARSQLWNFLQRSHPEDAGIVYCLSRKKVDATAEWLVKQGRTALPYHAGLPAHVRQRHQQRFLREESVIIVATIAFGMGIDKPDVRFVAHLNLPKSLEAYYQETGRAGRDGTAANAWMSYGLQDVIMLRQMMQESTADEVHKRVEHLKLEAMLGFCELSTCRRQALLAYFGETLEQPCGNCDNCLNPPETWDATEAARKALSSVYRTGQRFGVNYVVQVLTGKQDQRISANGHDRLSTYGIGEEFSMNEWKRIFRQLISLGHLEVDMERHGALRLTEHCRPVLKGEAQLELRKLQKPEQAGSTKKEKATTVRMADQTLWEDLRHLRLELAETQGVPSFVIFHDSTLKQMAAVRPQNLNEFSRLSGVGQTKLDRFGAPFLTVIKAHPAAIPSQPDLSDTVNDTLYLHQQGKDAATIAVERGVQVDTILRHFSEAIEAGLLDAREALGLSLEDFESLKQALEMDEDAEQGRLKPIFEALNEAWSYGILRCVRASVYGGR